MCARTHTRTHTHSRAHTHTHTQVEIVARCVRQWVDEDTLEAWAVRDAEAVVKAGCALLGNQCFMTILYSSFLIEVQGSYQSGYTQLQVCAGIESMRAHI